MKHHSLAFLCTLLTSTVVIGGSPIGGTINTNTTLQASLSPYLVTSNITVANGVTLTVEPGVIVKFPYDMFIEVQGTLNVNGTAQDSAVFTSWYDDSHGGNSDSTATPPARGDWRGIYYNAADQACSMDYCVVKYAGRYWCCNDNWGAMRIDGSSVSLTHSTVSEISNWMNGGRNLFVSNTGQLTMLNSILTGGNSYSGIENYGMLRVEDSEISFIARRGITTAGGSAILRNLSIHDNGAWGLYSTTLNATIDGVTCQYNGGQETNTGGIWCNGTGNTVTQTTVTNNTGRGLVVEGANSICTYNMSQQNGDGIWCIGQNTQFHDNRSVLNTGWGYVVNADLVDNIWQEAAMNTDSANGSGNAKGIYGGTVTQNATWINDYVYVVLYYFTVGNGTTLDLQPGVNVKFAAGDDKYMEVQGLLRAEGTAVDSIAFTSLYDDAHGGDTYGSSGNPARGDWRSLYFNGADGTCSMDYCVVKYGGRAFCCTDNWGAMYIGASSVSLTHSTVSEISNWMNGGRNLFVSNTGQLTMLNSILTGGNSYHGILSYGALDFTDSEISFAGYEGIHSEGTNCHFNNVRVHDMVSHGFWCSGELTTFVSCQSYNNGGYGFYSGGQLSNFSNNVAQNNGQYGYATHCNAAGEVSSDNQAVSNHFDNAISVLGGTISSDDTWENNYPFVVQGDISINASSTLLLQPGTVVKFNNYAGLVNYGTLVAQGTQVEKVVFTSSRDDAFGGDNNDDGLGTVPAPGDWSRILFQGSTPQSRLSWTVISYAGYNNNPALDLYNTTQDLSECIVIHNRWAGIRCQSNAVLDITYSDIYDNGFVGAPPRGLGLQNDNSTHTVGATNCWWGYANGPYQQSTNPGGSGNAVSNYVNYAGWLNRSIDNPWEVFASPDTSGLYTDVAVIDANGDDYLDLVATTEGEGVVGFLRSSFQSWDTGTYPISTGDWHSVSVGDFDEDSLADFVVGGNTGIRLFTGDGNGNWTQSPSPLTTLTVYDVQLVYLDNNFHLDLIMALGGDPGNGVRVFYGDGSGNWTAGNTPTSQNIYRHISASDFNNDGFRDIAATNSNSTELLGVRVWYGDSLNQWTAATSAGVNHAYYGLAVGDVNTDGFSDLVAGGNVFNEGVQVFWNNQTAGWNTGYTPSSQGIYNDILMADMNGDGRLDMVASGQGGGVSAWIGAPSGTWSYWYHPITSGIFRGLDVKDITLNNTRDLIAAGFGYGIRIWENRTPIVYEMPIVASPGNIDFGQVLVNYNSTETFRLTNVSEDTVHSIIVYTTNPRFQVSVSRDVGPFDLPPQSFIDMEIAFSPATPGVENEAVGIHSSVAVLYVPLHGAGVTAGVPDWLAAISVRNNQGGPGNSDSLHFGAGIGATDGLDVPYSEVDLPPLPPEELFDARWTILDYEGFDRDIRNRNQSEHTYQLQWQAGSSGYPITISWNPASLPAGSFLIHDGMGGIIVDTVSMKAVGSVVIGNPGLASLQIDYSALSSFDYGFGSGWSLSSIPVDPEFNEVDSLFPNALSAFWYNPSIPGYQQMNALDPGYGYWIEFPAPTNRVIYGMPVVQQTVILQQGWNLIGADWDTVAVSALTVDPPGSLISVWSFSGQYNQATTVQSGRGYWMNVTQICEISWPMVGAGSGVHESPWVTSNYMAVPTKAMTATNDDAPEGAWTASLDLSFGLQDSAAATRLRFGTHPDATINIDPAIGEVELPPVPPMPVHDARFVIDLSNGCALDLRSTDVEQVVYYLAWQTSPDGTPLRVTWDPSDLVGRGSFLFTDVTGGQLLPAVNMLEHSEMIIPDSMSMISEMLIVATFDLTGAEPQDDPTVPAVYDLKPCYPNPFNATTTIRFDMPRAAHLKLTVYNVLGQAVAGLADRQWPAGSHSIIWDGRDVSGMEIGSGVYLCTMESANFRKTIKLVVAK